MKKFLTLLLCALSFAAVGCAKDNGKSSEDSSGTEPETSVFTFTAEYDYGFHIQGEPYMLYGYYLPFFDVPNEHGAVVAGDVFTIEYTGALIRNDRYPGEAYLTDGGEIVSVTAQKAETVALICQVSWAPAEVGESDEIEFYLYNDGVVGEKVNVASRPEYYLTNEDGEIGFEEVTTAADGMVFYGTYSPVSGYDETDGYRLSGLYGWNPRGGMNSTIGA